jgi:RNA polymerase sigma-70 factor (ECF subfamily)
MAEQGEGGRAGRIPLAERILRSLPGLTRFVRTRMGPDLAARESASDIVQSTCRELLRGVSTFEERGDGSFERWVRGAAEHKLQNRARYWRAQRRQHDPAPLEGAGEGGSIDPQAPVSSRPSQDAMLREEAERLERAVRALPPDQRAVLVLSQIHGVSNADIAREMDRSPEAVRKLLARAMARLSTELEDPEDQRPGSGRTGRTPIA